MKKKSQKKKTESRRSQSSEDRALNRELGNFGLEPPKIYKSSSASNNIESFSRSRSRGREERELNDYTPQERRRQQNESRKKSKLRRKIIFYFVLTVSICAIIVVLSLTVLFKIQTIKIQGNQVYTKKEIATVLPIQENENLFLTDMSAASDKLEESLPYIYNAEIKRKLPSTVIVSITETPRVYCIDNGDKTYTYLDDSFKVLEANASKIPSGAVEIKKAQLVSKITGQTAEFENKKIKGNLASLASEITNLNIEKATSIYSEDINNNYIVYDNRITIKLGNLDNIDKKLYAALSAIEKLNETNPQAKGILTATNDKQVYFTAK